MSMVLIFVGVLLVGISDWLQPDQYHKPTLNRYMEYLGGILWLIGVVLAFMNYSIIKAILLLVTSFIVGAIIFAKPKRGKL
jgi:multisubunit Na+/H+ antiporter MnhG subunit